MVMWLLRTDDFSREQADMGVEEPCGGAGNGGFEILCKAPTSAEPGEGSLYHPASRQEHEPAGGVRALDDLYGPFADFGEASLEFGTGIAAIGKHSRNQGYRDLTDLSTSGAPSRSCMPAW